MGLFNFIKTKKKYTRDDLKEKNWKHLKYRERIDCVKQMYNEISSKIFNDSQNIVFNKNIQIFEALGYYDLNNKAVNVNDNYLKVVDNGFKLLEIISHELYHSYQYFILAHELDENYLKECTPIINGKIQIHNKDANLYIEHLSNSNNRDINRLEDMFYHLNILEREAFLFGYEQAGINNTPDKNQIYKYILEFNQRYKCDLSIDDTLYFIDKCYQKIYNNKEPRSDLEATVMYDMCIIALEQANSITVDQLELYLNPITKETILKDKGYEIYKPPFTYKQQYDYDLCTLENIALSAIHHEKDNPYIDTYEIDDEL